MPDIFIRGFEILENNKIANHGAQTTVEQEDDDGGPLSNRNNDGNIFGLTPEFIFNFDGYEMDNYGHLPGDSRTPTPQTDGYRPLCMRRTPSPSTKQIIRVDVKVNRKNSKKNSASRN